MAWAGLACARWRAGDLPGAEDALEQATRDFERTPAEDLEPPEEAERTRVTAAFRYFQGRREEALALAEAAVPRHREARSPDLGRALVLRAELRASKERFAAAIEDLDEARQLDPSARGIHLFELWLDLPVSLGDRAEMAKALPEARRWAETLDDEGALPRLRWFEGHCRAKERERRLREARDGFAAACEDAWVARTTLDLARVVHDEGRADDLAVLASELAVTLGTLATTAESLAVLRTLREASAAGGVTAAVLDEVGSVLGGMGWDARGRRTLWLAG